MARKRRGSAPRSEPARCGAAGSSRRSFPWIAAREQQGKLALQSAQVQQVQQSHQNFINLAQTNIQGLESVDPATAITQLNQVEINLQASYQSISTLQQLSLVNFLK